MNFFRKVAGVLLPSSLIALIVGLVNLTGFLRIGNRRIGLSGPETVDCAMVMIAGSAMTLLGRRDRPRSLESCSWRSLGCCSWSGPKGCRGADPVGFTNKTPGAGSFYVEQFVEPKRAGRPPCLPRSIRRVLQPRERQLLRRFRTP